MSAFEQFLNPAEAARRLGVSTKALRLYEQHGLIAPIRTAARWRVYSAAQMNRAARIAAFRAVGFGLGQIADLLDGDDAMRDAAFNRHEASLANQASRLAESMTRIRTLRADLSSESAGARRPALAFELPWPWGGERFELACIRPLTYIVGPLGSGKTRLAGLLAQHLPGAAYLGLGRVEDMAAIEYADADHRVRIECTLEHLVATGARRSLALAALVAGIEAAGPDALVIDMIEDGLDEPTQRAVIGYLRHGRADNRPFVVMTRSTAILDLAAVGRDEAIILCPANHSPPMLVVPLVGAPGYEALASCLASPEVRARTAGGRAEPHRHDCAAIAPA